MVIWLNGCFGVGKTETAKVLQGKLGNAHLFDPEQVGFFLWEQFPEPLKRKGDFQDLALWRTVTYEMISHLHHSYDGHLIVPMTLVNRDYDHEIIGRLRRDGVDVRHFILSASRETIRKRLRRRGEPENSWAEQQLDRCLAAFAEKIPGEVIDTEQGEAGDVAGEIAEKLFSRQ